MSESNLNHQPLYEYDTIENIAETYKKSVQHIASLMQQKNISSLGLRYDELFNFEGNLSSVVKPSQHEAISFEIWKDYQFDDQEIFLYGIAGVPALGSTLEILSGYKDIRIHKEEFRKKSGLIKTSKRIHAITEVIKELYLEIGKGTPISPSEFISELYDRVDEDDRIAEIQGLSDNDTITFWSSFGQPKTIKISSLKTRISSFNGKI